jgi:hypothetical protein
VSARYTVEWAGGHRTDLTTREVVAYVSGIREARRYLSHFVELAGARATLRIVVRHEGGGTVAYADLERTVAS